MRREDCQDWCEVQAAFIATKVIGGELIIFSLNTLIPLWVLIEIIAIVPTCVWCQIVMRIIGEESETGFRNWVPKFGNCKILGRPNIQGGPQYTQISTINTYKFIKIRHDIHFQCHGNYMEMKKVNYMLEIDILRNSSQKDVGVLRDAFEGFGCPKRYPDALLAKTMARMFMFDNLIKLRSTIVMGHIKMNLESSTIFWHPTGLFRAT